MIFNSLKNSNDQHKLESYKERNLYYKIFAGYLFNELVDGYNERKNSFFKRLEKTPSDRIFGEVPKVLKDSRQAFLNEPIHVTFDFHPSQWDSSQDRGEMSDIVIWMDKSFYSIEVKYLSHWTYAKDIATVQNRIQVISRMISEDGDKKAPLQILLVKMEDWTNSESRGDISNVEKLKNNILNIPVIVIFWEELLEIIGEPNVKSYLEHAIIKTHKSSD